METLDIVANSRYLSINLLNREITQNNRKQRRISAFYGVLRQITANEAKNTVYFEIRGEPKHSKQSQTWA